MEETSSLENNAYSIKHVDDNEDGNFCYLILAHKRDRINFIISVSLLANHPAYIFCIFYYAMTEIYLSTACTPFYSDSEFNTPLTHYHTDITIKMKVLTLD